MVNFWDDESWRYYILYHDQNFNSNPITLISTPEIQSPHPFDFNPTDIGIIDPFQLQGPVYPSFRFKV